MSAHRRLQKTMRSPVRQVRRNKQHKVNRRLAIAAEGFMTDTPGGALLRVRTVENLLVLAPRSELDRVFLDQRSGAKRKADR